MGVEVWRLRPEWRAPVACAAPPEVTEPAAPLAEELAATAVVVAPPTPVLAPLPASVIEPPLSEPLPGAVILPMTVASDWDGLAAQVRDCTRCGLHQGRQQAVFGSGDRHARWLFIGEGPGAEEDRQGEPFVGPAGQLLTSMVAALGMQRHEVYIANVVKCRPPGNRDPEAAEVASCIGYLQRQIELVQPAVIVLLGRVAAHAMLQTEQPLGSMRGQMYRYAGDVPMIVTYHPAYLLRSPQDKRKAWQDLCLAKRVMASI